MKAAELTQKLKTKAVELGFELSGTTPAVTPSNYPDFLDWLNKGYAGEMGYPVPQSIAPEISSGQHGELDHPTLNTQPKAGDPKGKVGYLARRKEERGNPSSLLPGAKSVFCVALSYNPRPEHAPLLENHPISCYAWGKDYHEVLGEKLETLTAYLKELAPDAKAKHYVDTGPVLERSYSAQAGLGWTGKNTLLLNKKFGSFLFLGEILTDVELAYDEPVDNLCKTCTTCLDACPVGALEEPGLLNANKCISYLTLEHRSDLPNGTKLHGYLAGCDLCQTVCPYNVNAPAGREPAFQLRPEVLTLTHEKAAQMDEKAFKEFTKDSALERIKYPMWKRNIQAQ